MLAIEFIMVEGIQIRASDESHAYDRKLGGITKVYAVRICECSLSRQDWQYHG